MFVEDEPMGVVDQPPSGAPVFSWIHTDRLGTPLAVTSTPGSGAAKTIWRASYEPFGLATPNPDPDGDGQSFALDLRFPGQVFDAESGGHDNHFRAYDPSLGRYFEADPIGQEAGANLYRYVFADPVNWIDPSGLEVWICDRATRGPMPGNHAYLWNPETGDNEGRGGESSGGGPGNSDEEPRKNGDACNPVLGSEGKEDAILDDLNETANEGPWTPFVNDCHNSINRALERNGVPAVSSPNGRFGRGRGGTQKP